MTPSFVVSHLGDRCRLPRGARLEGRICWDVDDPEQGDGQWQIAPGTECAGLPARWTCPRREGRADQFRFVK